MEDAVNPELTSHLNALVRDDDVEGVRAAVEKGIDIPDACADVDADGWSPFTLAADLGSSAILEIFLKAEVPVDSKNFIGGWRAIHCAACNGHMEIISQLLKAGAEINVTDTEEWTPLHYAAEKDAVGICATLVAGGADVNAQTIEGYTPLYLACQAGKRPVAELLLTHDARHDIDDEEGWTPLQVRSCQLQWRHAIVKAAQITGKLTVCSIVWSG